MVIGRNDLCPCGSGKKYKKCCLKARQSPINGLKPGLRMKGGVAYDPASAAFLPVVHSWDNVECDGVPEEWMSPESFSSEDEAMAYYKTHIRPLLKSMMIDLAKEDSCFTFGHREL